MSDADCLQVIIMAAAVGYALGFLSGLRLDRDKYVRLKTLAGVVRQRDPESPWWTDVVLLVIAVLIGVAAGLSILSFFWPNFFESR